MKLRYDTDKEKFIIVESDRIEYNQLSIWLNRHVKNYRFNPKFKFGAWNGKIDYFNSGQINLGLWKEIYKALNEIGCKFEIENKEDFPVNRKIEFTDVKNFCDEFFKNHKIIDKKTGEKIPFKPYDYQIETAFKILKNRYCLAEVATSGGKSLILSIVFFYLLKRDPDYKILVVLPSISLIVQLHDNLIEYNKGIFNENDNKLDLKVEEIMSDKPRKHSGNDKPNIYLGTYQSLSKSENWNKKFFKQFNLIAVDESHKAKAKSIKTILTKTFGHAEYRFGVSGTFPEENTCEILSIQSLTGPIIKSVKAKELQDMNKISNVKIKCVLLNHDDPEFDIQLSTIRKNPNLGNKAYQLEKKYIHNSEKRGDFISKIVGRFEKNALLLFNIIEHGESILEKLKKEHPDKKFLYIDGNVKKDERNEIIKEMEYDDDQIRVLVASYGTLSTGVSINNLHYLIFCDSFKSESLIIQSIGRLLRKFKDKTAVIFDIIDCFKDSNQKNSFFRHGLERKRLYRKHQYPYETLKFIL